MNEQNEQNEQDEQQDEQQEEQFEESEFAPQDQTDVIGLLKKIQQQLGFLEKKVDMLLGKSPDRPFNREKRFSKPFRSFGNSRNNDRSDRSHAPRERSFDQDRPFDRERSFDRDRGFNRDRGNDNRGSENRGFGGKKKPFFRGRKSRD